MRKEIIKRPNMSLWRRTSAFVIWYALAFIISLILFVSIANFRLVVRAIDILTNEGLYKTFDALSLQLFLECLLILILFFMFCRNTILFYGVLLNVKRIKASDELLMSGGNSFGFEGEQGVGKTRSMVYAGMLLAESRAEELCYKYYLDLPIRDRLKESDRLIEFRRFRAREESFLHNFIEKPENIPMLHANVDVVYEDAHPHELSVKHFEMKERLYENNVKILTEADDFFPNTLRKKKKAKKGEETKKPEDELDANAVDKFVGLDRQYTNGTLISDTHANGDIFKGIRTCQSFTLYLTRAEYRYTPGILKRIENKLKKRVIKLGDSLYTPKIRRRKVAKKFYSLFFNKKASLEERLMILSSKISSRKTRKKLKKLARARKRVKRVQELEKKISITRIYYRKISGPGDFQTADKELFYVLPNQVPYSYDDRIFQKEYKFTAQP